MYATLLLELYQNVTLLYLKTTSGLLILVLFRFYTQFITLSIIRYGIIVNFYNIYIYISLYGATEAVEG